jgi:ribonuclease VapC
LIIDTSAIVAILLCEPDAHRYASAISHAKHRRISAANWLEASLVVDRRGDPVARDAFETFFARTATEILPVTAETATRAREANIRFGRGHHPAALNYGDCFAYATASLANEPLLFKGDDFPHTDIESALKD